VEREGKMGSKGLHQFLIEAKAKLPITGHFRAVIGNEASDADSMITALTVAYLRHHTQEAQTPVVPVIACMRDDLQFRPETIKLLQLCQIELDSLIHVDQIDLPGAHTRGELELTLTDHNTGSLQAKAGMGDAITEIIDHHEDAGGQLHLQSNLRRIEFGEAKGYAPGHGMGSACTLVAELFLEQAPQLMDATVNTLLAAVILLDTNNCKNEAKVTPRDQAAVEKLFHMAGMAESKDDLYLMLQDAKTDPAYWSTVSTYDMLRSDFKGFQINTRHFGIASVNGGAGDLVELFKKRGNDEVLAAFARFAEETGGEILLAMCCYPYGGWHDPRRDFIVYSPSILLREAMTDFLKDHQLVRLQEVQCTIPDMKVFRQLNVNSSRKQLQPLVVEFYETTREKIEI